MVGKGCVQMIGVSIPDVQCHTSYMMLYLVRELRE
jgi:hypothetical protein